jgi:uncharacterized HAD superfamily protein
MNNPLVSDIDGTLTSEPYNSGNILEVRPKSEVLLIALVHQKERPLLISTARPNKWRKQTEEWLEAQGLHPEKLYMREEHEKDFPDPVVKKRHLNSIREEYGNPVLWLEDNPENIKMLESNKVAVIAIKRPYVYNE